MDLLQTIDPHMDSCDLKLVISKNNGNYSVICQFVPKQKDIVMPAFVLSGTLEEIDAELPKQLFEKTPEAAKTIQHLDYVAQLKEVEKANTQTSTPSSSRTPEKKDPNREKADKFAAMAADFLGKNDFFQAKGHYKEAMKLFPGDAKYKEGLQVAEKKEKDSTDLFAQYAPAVETKTFVPVNIEVEQTHDPEINDDDSEDPDAPLGETESEADEVENIKDSIIQ